MKFIPIDESNIDKALKIQLQIFPKESALEEYVDIINRKQEFQRNYMVYYNDAIIGITGLYSNEPLDETNSIWLCWFGVLKQYRKRGYGKKILEETIEISKKCQKSTLLNILDYIPLAKIIQNRLFYTIRLWMLKNFIKMIMILIIMIHVLYI